MNSRLAAALAPFAVASAVGLGTFTLVFAAFGLFMSESVDSPLWWPATAAVVAVMVRCPLRWWWGVVAGFGLGLLAASLTQASVEVSLTYFIANVVEAVTASVVLSDRWAHRDRRMHVWRDAVRFSVAAVAAVGIGAVMIAISASINSDDSITYAVLGGYTVNHLLGYLSVAPLLLPSKRTRTWALWSGVEFAGVVVAICGLSVWALMQLDSDGRAYVMLAPVMWSAVRFGAGRATAMSALTCALAAYATAHGRGPLASSADMLQRQFLTEVFILVVTASTLGLVLVTRHRVQLAAAARDSEQTLRVAIRDALIGMYSIRLDAGRVGEIRDVNTALCRLLGYRPEHLIGRHCSILGALDDPRKVRLLHDHLDHFAAGTVASLREESTFLTATGERRWVELNLSTVNSVGEARYILVNVHDLTERENAKRSLERMALHDPLTGLANRTLLFRRLGAEMAIARAAGRKVGLLYLDLDRFKAVNDTHGHDAGDAVLVDVARRLSGAVRQDATVARLGGDEFAILCPRTESVDELTAIADRIRRLLREPIRITVGGENKCFSAVEVTVDASVGFGTASGADSADDLIRAADQAMYAVKQRRRVPRL